MTEKKNRIQVDPTATLVDSFALKSYPFVEERGRSSSAEDTSGEPRTNRYLPTSPNKYLPTRNLPTSAKTDEGDETSGEPKKYLPTNRYLPTSPKRTLPTSPNRYLPTKPRRYLPTSAKAGEEDETAGKQGKYLTTRYLPTRYLPTFANLSSEPKKYTPVLYTFRVKIKNPTSKLFKNIPTKALPYHIQLDHTLAVTWTLFSASSDKKSLGINQLQWACHFLMTIVTIEGIHPRDVQLVIDTITDYLIAEYAELSEESVVYAGDNYPGPIGDVDYGENTPFSINYAQMIERYSPGMPVSESNSEVLDRVDRELMEELENVKRIVGIESVDLSKVASKEQVMEILTDMQKEQIEKITNEVKMLYVVEDMMKNTDTEKFKGYTDEQQFITLFKKGA